MAVVTWHNSICLMSKGKKRGEAAGIHRHLLRPQLTGTGGLFQSSINSFLFAYK